MGLTLALACMEPPTKCFVVLLLLRKFVALPLLERDLLDFFTM